MTPFVIGATTLLGGLAVLELISRGQIRSIDNSSDIYLALLGAYAGAGELKRWFSKEQVDCKEDPWLERARKGGMFVTFWLVLYAAALLWRVADSGVPMPHELKAITLRTIGVFFVTYSSRRLHRARRSDSGIQEPDNEAVVLAALGRSPSGLSRRQITEQLPEIPPRTLARVLGKLSASRQISRDGHPNSPDATFRIVTAN